MKERYSSTIGYSSLDLVDQNRLLQLIKVNKSLIDEYITFSEQNMILVAGAGLGHEAYLIHKEFKIKTVGVDLNVSSNYNFSKIVGLFLQRQNLNSLAFRNNTFNLVYCYHVLEHVKDPKAVLQEFYRVMKPSGILFIGFPNRKRLISYIGTSQKASIFDKISWNINDYIFRLRGKFENKYGAHAGFSEKEFLNEASSVFESIEPVRNTYMFRKYRNHYRLIDLIIKTKTEEFIFPSNYYICIKR